jgi:hypothetical protein
MTGASRARRAAGIVCLLTVAAAPVRAQDAAAPGSGEPQGVRWTVGVGYEQFGFRDVARASRPVDASPVTLSGWGPAVRARHSRLRPGRLQQFDVSASRVGGLSYDTRAGSRATPSGNRAARLEARYEYRRYPFTDLLMTGLDAGLGVLGSGGWTSISRVMSPALDSRDRALGTGIAAVAALRMRRWDRVDVTGTWSYGGVITRRRLQHSASGLASSGLWGGGWQADWSVGADVRTSHRTRLSLEALGGGGVRLASHQSHALSRTRLTVGVTHVR